jgi:KEOPS complex subunit Cgi121
MVLYIFKYYQEHIMEYNIKLAGFVCEISDLKSLMAQIKDICQGMGSGCAIQLLRAEGIAGEKHLKQATIQAIKSFERDENIAKDMGLEICVRASAQRQITLALDVLGIKEGSMEVCVVALNCGKDVINKLEKILGSKNDDVLKPEENMLKQIYNISEKEIEASGSLIRILIERTALLTVEI